MIGVDMRVCNHFPTLLSTLFCLVLLSRQSKEELWRMAYTWGDATLCAGDWFLQQVAQAFRNQVLNFVYALLPFLAFCDRRKRADLSCTFGSLSGGKDGRDSGMMRAFDSRHFLPSGPMLVGSVFIAATEGSPLFGRPWFNPPY
jgi:hypothetical protein